MPYDENSRDASKIVIKSELVAGELYRRLIEKYGIQPEMYGEKAMLCMTSVCDDEEAFERLSDALYKEDKRITEEAQKGLEQNAPRKTESIYKNISEQVLLPCEVVDMPVKVAELEKSAEEISADYITLYPPGIPIIVPGERISGEMVSKLQELMKKGYNITGLEKGGVKVI